MTISTSTTHGEKVSLALSVITLTACLAASAAGCAPQAAANKNPQPESEPLAVSITWSPDADCTVCHVDEGATMAEMPCAESTGNTVDCIACHADKAGLAEVHEGATTDERMPSRLKKTDINVSACESCHGSYEMLAEKTLDSTVLTDSNGKTVNPHAMPATEKHANIACGSCHKMHSEDDATVTAPKACSSCHHTGVYECGTCHEKK